MLSDEDWFKFALGGTPHPVPVFRLPPALSGLMGAYVDMVYIGQFYAAKIRFKHGLSPEYFPLMAATIAHGTVLQQKDGKLGFFYDHGPPYGLVELVIKVTRRGHQLWVCSYHRTKKSELARKKRRYKVIRP